MSAANASPIAITRLERKIKKAKAQGMHSRAEKLEEKLAAAKIAVAAAGFALPPSELEKDTYAAAPGPADTGGDEGCKKSFDGPAVEYDPDKEVEIDLERDLLKVFASRLPKKWKDADLAKAFEIAFGDVAEARVAKADDDQPDKPLCYGFVTFADPESKRLALETGVLKARPSADRTEAGYKIRIGDVEVSRRDRERAKGGRISKEEVRSALTRVCGLWRRGICPYHSGCKFEHIGEGGMAAKPGAGKAKTKCFKFKKTGKCEKGDACPFLHVGPSADSALCPKVYEPRPKSEKPCLTFVKKGVCKKRGYGCPYSHAEELLEKRKRKAENAERNAKKAKKQKAIDEKLKGKPISFE